jgi:AcrR family transcriptional regulator
MTSTTRRRAPDSDRRSVVEGQILAATEQLLRDGSSFTDLGVQRIAAAAGVSRSSFYVCFRDKTDLLIRLAGTLKQQVLDVAQDWHPAGPGGGPDGLAAVFRAIIAFYRRHADLLGAITEVAAYDPAVAGFWNSELDRFTDRTAELIRAEQDAGRTAADIDPVIAARVMTWDGNQVIARHVASGEESLDAAVARELALIRWHGVYRRPAG